jgi:glucose-1-phosphate cytidylyltransferase
MKTVILAGGLGTRLSEETVVRPKPMVEIGGHPMLWHIMQYFASFGFKEFGCALGYKGDIIKQYFLNFYTLNANLTVDLRAGTHEVFGGSRVDWLVHLVDTGEHTQTGARIRRMQSCVGDDPLFFLTYGDGLANVDLRALLAFHKSHGKVATVTAVRPPGRFGALSLDGARVERFAEKPQTGEGWINGGFFVLDRRVFDYIDDSDGTVWEQQPLDRLTADGQLMAFCHTGFWIAMDTLRDKRVLEDLWNSGAAPWHVWP